MNSNARFLRRPLARAYLVLWLAVAAAMSLVGSVAGQRALTPMGLVVWTGSSALAGAGCYWMLVHELGPARVPLRVDRLLLAAVATGLFAWVLVGLHSLTGVSGCVALFVLVGLSPSALRALARHHRDNAGPWPRQTVSPPTAMRTTEQLCEAWRLSFAALSDSSNVSERLQEVLLREGLLAELERRDPAGFAMWITQGATAANDPGRYVGHFPTGA